MDDWENNPDYLFKEEYIGVERFLDLASQGDWSNYCASYTFTDRDFSNGVLGLAWIASTGGRIQKDNLSKIASH